MSKLKILRGISCCPFCGELKDLELFSQTPSLFIQCQTCTATGPYGEDMEIAIAQWNNNFREVEI